MFECFKKIDEPKKMEQQKIELTEMEKLDFISPWYNIAKKELGILEISGPKHNPRILEYLKTVSIDFKADEIAWCAAFVNWVFKQCEAQGTGKANARSYLKWGRRTKKPQLGDIVVLWRGSIDSWQGHVGFYAGEKSNKILILGGNQKNKVSFEYYNKNRILEIRTIRPV